MPRLDDDAAAAQALTLDLEGQPIAAREGDSVACALLAAGESVFSRSLKYHRPRGPFCMTGSCSHCLMRVDGVPNVFTCRTRAQAGMRVERQNAYPSAEHDVFGAIDWLFPRGLDHHEMFAGVPVAEQVMAKVARHLAGLGLLPEKPAPARLPQQTVRTEVAIAGAGAAGLAAARELAQAGVPFLVLEREEGPGGRLAFGALGFRDPPLATFTAAVTGKLRARTTIIGMFDDEQGRYLAAVEETADGPRLVKTYARAFLIATGGYPSMWPFENNELPGVYSARAVGVLLRREHFMPGTTFALVGFDTELYDVARLLEEKGARVTAIVDVHGAPPVGAPEVATRGEPLKAHGRSAVKAFSFKTADGATRKVECDGLVIAVPPSPAFELARQGGAHLRYSERHQTFVVDADEHGKTSGDAVWVAGDVRGADTIAQAADSGARAARAIVQSLGAGGGAR